MRYEGPSIFGTLYRLQVLLQQSMCRTRRIQMHTQHYRNYEFTAKMFVDYGLKLAIFSWLSLNMTMTL